MVSVLSLWLPILLSAIGVFALSSIIHMLLPYHRSNMSQVENEDEFAKSVGALNIAPGEYMFPFACDPKAMDSEDYKAKLDRGPVGMMTIMPNGPWSMGTSLVQWFIYALAVSVFAAYIASRTLDTGASYLAVMQLVGAAAFACYAMGQFQSSIWYFRKWSTTFKFIFDGFVYATVTGGFFGWLWPVA